MPSPELSHYRILDRLGGGGMGVVYLANDTRLNRRVAVKFLQSRFTGDPQAKQRFLLEARAASAIDHPNICTIHEIEEAEDGELCLVMAYYEGKTLAERIRSGPLPIDEAVDLTSQLMSGLSRAHEAGIIHRDIKPGNLIITSHQELKILDFGLAKLASQPVEVRGDHRIQGTAAYMSPEQVSGQPVDHRTDLWSSGVVLYEMLAGRSAFPGSNPAAILKSVLQDEPASLSSLRDDLPPALEQVVRTALTKDPAFRYQTARKMLEDLETPSSAFASPPTLAYPVVGKPMRGRSILVLPFSLVAPEPDFDYFVDGLTDEVITDLSGVEALRVISRTSAMQLKGTTKSIPVLARDLNVQFVLEGTVRIRGEAFRLTAKLVDAARDCNIWAEKFSGSLDDLLEIEEDLSRDIVRALKVRLSPGEEERLGQRPIRDPQAYQYYLRAKQEILQYTEEALDRAIQYLEEATRLTGDNVLLLSARGHAYWQYVNAGISTDSGLVTKARECAERVLALEPDSSHGHRLMGLVHITEGDPQEAVRSLKISLARDPSDSDTLAWLLACYALVGHPAAGAPVAEKLLRIDPLTPIYQCLPGVLAMMAGELDRAFPPFARAFEMEPGNPVVRLFYGQLLAFTGRREEAVEHLDRLAREAEGSLFGELGRFYARALEGRHEQALEAMGESSLAAARRDPEYSWMVAECYALTGEAETALEWLGNAEARGFINYPLLAELDPLLEGVRTAGEFQALVTRVQTRWRAFEV